MNLGPKPPVAPRSVDGLCQEMLTATFNPGALSQGTLHYWLMWRLPQIRDAIASATGTKLYLSCGSVRDLAWSFPRLVLLSDLLVVGQSGSLMEPEVLTHLHNLDRPWPEMEPARCDEGLWALAATIDRPVSDGVFPFLSNVLAPFVRTGKVLYSPLATMLAPSRPTGNLDTHVREQLDTALDRAKPDGLPTRIVLVNDERPAATDNRSQVETDDRAEADLRVRTVADDAWVARDVVALELCLSEALGMNMLVAGEWCDVIPPPQFELKLSIPYLEGIPPWELAKAISDDPEAFRDFRRAIRSGLREASKARGSESYAREIERIQDEIIDAGIDKLDMHWRSLMSMRVSRFAAYTVAATPLVVGLFCGATPAQLAILFAQTGANAIVSYFLEREKRSLEQGKLHGEPMFFLWKLGPGRPTARR